MIKISNAELEVMKVIWEMKETTSLEIINQLEYCNWNINTIRTLINRLVDKKAIGISKKKGKSYVYVPLIDKNTYKTKRAKQFAKQFYNGFILNMILDFIETGELTKNELEKLIK